MADGDGGGVSDEEPPFEWGDDEPEDAWDPDDPTDVLVADLIRRVALLERDPVAVPTDNLLDSLRCLSELVAVARQRRLTGHDLERADELDADITYLWNNRL
jgi:hypothetical protein